MNKNQLVDLIIKGENNKENKGNNENNEEYNKLMNKRKVSLQDICDQNNID